MTATFLQLHTVLIYMTVSLPVKWTRFLSSNNPLANQSEVRPISDSYAGYASTQTSFEALRSFDLTSSIDPLTDRILEFYRADWTLILWLTLSDARSALRPCLLDGGEAQHARRQRRGVRHPGGPLHGEFGCVAFHDASVLHGPICLDIHVASDFCP